MFISAPGSIFLFYLAVLVSFGSETVYSVPKNRFESSVVLFLASFVISCINILDRFTQPSLLSATTQNIWPSNVKRTLRDGSTKERLNRLNWRPYNHSNNHYSQFKRKHHLLKLQCSKVRLHLEVDLNSKQDPEEGRWHNSKQTIDINII